jgi:lipopolysaccharide export LptBFGC system permease protein LptF
MKEDFISLFDNTHKKKTIYLFVIAAMFIIISLSVDISDNSPMIVMLLTGIIFLYFAVLHPWGKADNYGILVGVCVSILLLEFLGITIISKMHKTEYINEGIANLVLTWRVEKGVSVRVRFEKTE